MKADGGPPLLKMLDFGLNGSILGLLVRLLLQQFWADGGRQLDVGEGGGKDCISYILI